VRTLASRPRQGNVGGPNHVHRRSLYEPASFCQGARVHPRWASKLAVLVGLLGAVACTSTSHHVEPTGDRCEHDDLVGGMVEPAAQEVVVAVHKKAWEAALGGEEAARPAVRARLTGWPHRLLIDPSTLPPPGRAFLERLARDTWHGIAAFTDREHALPVDHVRIVDEVVGDYTNVTTIGLHLIATVAAHDLGLLTADDAVAALARTLATLEGLERHAGFFFNYYDTTSLERTSNFISFVDSSWLTTGLMIVRATFPTLRPTCDRLIDGADYAFFYDPALGRMSHGFYVHRGERSRYHYGVLYAESRLGSLIAIGKGDVPPSHWFRMVRTFPAACRWQAERPQGRERKSAFGQVYFGGHYEWGGVRYVPSWGGSMFEALMPTLVFDETRHAPASLGANGRAHAEVQRRFAVERLGYPVWGLSPASRPAGDGYGEYGVRPLGSLGYPAGAVTPHAAALALAVDAAAAANLRTLATRYPSYGEYGFYDSLDPLSGRVAYRYLALDQAMTLIAIANHLRGGRIQKRFAADPIVARAVSVVAVERFFE